MEYPQPDWGFRRENAVLNPLHSESVDKTQSEIIQELRSELQASFIAREKQQIEINDLKNRLRMIKLVLNAESL